MRIDAMCGLNVEASCVSPTYVCLWRRNTLYSSVFSVFSVANPANIRRHARRTKHSEACRFPPAC